MRIRPAYASSRRSFLFSRLALAIILGMLCLLFVAGCESSEEAAYKDKIAAFEGRWNQTATQFETQAKELAAQMDVIFSTTSSSDPAAYANYVSTIDAYLPKFQATLSQIQQYLNELNQIQPPARFSNEHKMYVNSVNTTLASLQQLGQGVANMRTVQDMKYGIAQVNTAQQYVTQGDKNLKQAHDYLFKINWGTIGVIGFFVLLVFVGCGFWAGVLGRNDGRSFGDYFCLGLFLGPIGLFVAWRKTRWGPAPAVQQQPRLAGPAGYTDPGYWPQPQAVYPEQAYAPPLTNAPWDSAPPGAGFAQATQDPYAPQQQGFSHAPSDTFAAPYGTCTTCGAAITVPDAVFCPSCGASV